MKLKYDETLSKFAIKFNLRRYTKEEFGTVTVDFTAPVAATDALAGTTGSATVTGTRDAETTEKFFVAAAAAAEDWRSATAHAVDEARVAAQTVIMSAYDGVSAADLAVTALQTVKDADANQKDVADKLILSNDAATLAAAKAGAEATVALKIVAAQSLVRGTAELCIHLTDEGWPATSSDESAAK